MKWIRTSKIETHLLYYIRTLSEHLTHLVHDRPFRSIAFTSAVSGEGKSTFAFHLARYYRKLGLKVAYLDFDYSKNRYISGLASSAVPLNEFLNGKAELKDIAARGRVDIFKSEYSSDMKELLKSARMDQLWKELHDQYELVIVDTPGVTEDSYGLGLAERSDLCVYVVGSAKTDKAHIDASLVELEECGVRPDGMILNQVNQAYIDDPKIKKQQQKSGWQSLVRRIWG